MTIGFLFFFLRVRGGVAVFWREKEETDEMTGGKKMSRLKPNIRKSTGLDEMPVPQKKKKNF